MSSILHLTSVQLELLLSYLHAFWNRKVSFYCSLKTPSIFTWCVRELLTEKTLWGHQEIWMLLQSIYRKILIIVFSIFLLSDSLYCILNWVFIQLDGIQLVICWCELSKGRRELNYMWHSECDERPCHYQICSERKHWMADEQPKRAAEMGQAVSDQREQSCKAVVVIFICPDLQISGETAKPLFLSVDTISTINRTNSNSNS